MERNEELDDGSMHDDEIVGERRCAANDHLCPQQHAQAATPRHVVQQAKSGGVA
jgi:hypothetical protein